MISRASIIVEYERREAAAGGVAKADPLAICRDTAEALGLTKEEVGAVMLDWWSMAGGS